MVSFRMVKHRPFPLVTLGMHTATATMVDRGTPPKVEVRIWLCSYPYYDVPVPFVIVMHAAVTVLVVKHSD